jgi:hypothetical protein
VPLVMGRLDSQHPFVTARTKVIFLMKANGAFDFDARRPAANMLNASSYVDGLAWTAGELGIHQRTAEIGSASRRVHEVDERQVLGHRAAGRRAPGPRLSSSRTPRLGRSPGKSLRDGFASLARCPVARIQRLRGRRGRSDC